MTPLLLFPIALLTPFALALVFFVPIYGALVGASYIYSHAAPTQANALLAKWQDVFFIFDTYKQLFGYWRSHLETVDHLYYSAPLLILPLIGLFIAQKIARRIIRKLVDLFHVVTAR